MEFSNYTMTTSLIPGKPATWIPIPHMTNRCEKNGSSITAFPLQVCQALIMHKSQGMTIGDGQQFKNCIVHLPEGKHKDPALALVACSRASKSTYNAIGNALQEISKQELKKIGNTKAYDKGNSLRNLDNHAKGPQQNTIDLITI